MLDQAHEKKIKPISLTEDRRQLSQWFHNILGNLANNRIDTAGAKQLLDDKSKAWDPAEYGDISQWLGTSAMCFSSSRSMQVKLSGFYKLPDEYLEPALVIAVAAMTNHIRKAQAHEPERVGKRYMYLDGVFLSGDPDQSITGVIPKLIEKLSSYNPTEQQSRIYAMRILAAAILPANHYSPSNVSPHYQKTNTDIPDHRAILLSEILRTSGKATALHFWSQIIETPWSSFNLLDINTTPVITAYSPGNYFTNQSYSALAKVPKGNLVPYYMNAYATTIPNPESRFLIQEDPEKIRNYLAQDLCFYRSANI